MTANKKEEGTEKADRKAEEGTTDKETDEGSEQDSKKDQDSDVSFQEDADEEIDATENEEDWIEYIKRSTKEAEEHMERAQNKMLGFAIHIEDTSGGWHGESLSCPQKDGTEEFSTGILDWTPASEQEGKLEDLKEDWKTT